MNSISARELVEYQPVKSGWLTQYIDYSIFFCLFLYCNSIWVWPTDAQMSVGFQKPFASLHQYACCLGLFWTLLMSKWSDWTPTRAQNLLFAFIVLIVASVLWSTGKSTTFKSDIVVISLVVFAQYYVRKYGSTVVLNQLIVASTLVLLLSVAAAIAHVNIALMAGFHEGLWRGFFVHKNPFGAFAAFYALLVVFAAGKLGYGLAARTLMLALVLVVLAKSSSSTAVLALASAIALVTGVLTLRSMTRNAVLTWLFIAVFAGPVVFAIWEYFASVLEMVGRDATFSGRDRVWAYFLRLIEVNGFWGTGYGTPYLREAFAADAQDALFSSVQSPHNAFLGLALNIGWVGTGLFGAWLMANLLSAIGVARNTKFGSLYLGFCGFSILLCLVETTGWADITRGDFFFLYVSALIAGQEITRVAAPKRESEILGSLV
ncbi:O-antigen ligase family protein [Rhizobium sp. LjRoot254]|uniref:O-antigen ligase family protein n=1 Tax=Rhizobium sp. LjRoot254 TaxID=3342297 RepID=UPI003ECD93C2